LKKDAAEPQATEQKNTPLMSTHSSFTSVEANLTVVSSEGLKVWWLVVTHVAAVAELLVRL
jgi:hypothetical protein